MVSSIQHQQVSRRRVAPDLPGVDRQQSVIALGHGWSTLHHRSTAGGHALRPSVILPAARLPDSSGTPIRNTLRIVGSDRTPGTAPAAWQRRSTNSRTDAASRPGFPGSGVRARPVLRSATASFAATVQALAAALASGLTALFHRERTVDLALLAAVLITPVVLATVAVPDGVLMHLAQPAQEVPLPDAMPSERLFDDLASGDGSPSAASSSTSSVDLRQFERLEVRQYRLVAGDTVSTIAARHGLRIDTLASFNGISDARRIRVGDLFQIPNRDGLLHSVARGESLSSIASRYGTTVNALLDANDLRSATIAVGQRLFVPEARMSRADLQRVLGELFVTPARGRLTSGFGMRNDPFTGIRRFHNGIDLAAAVGTPVRAARAGRVVHVENQPGNYGRFVIVRHDGGYQTLYAHLDSYSVRVGQSVNQGQSIGSMGNTGRSTGPHLHFSVIKDGSFVDPMRYLR